MKTAILNIMNSKMAEKIASHEDSVAALFDEFCAEGRAVHSVKPSTEWEERAEHERHRLNAQFPGRYPKRTIIDKESLIRSYHEIYYRGKFPFGFPDNFLGPREVGAIVKITERNGEFA